MIALSNQQLEIVTTLARPLLRRQREQFLQAVARRLDGVEIGDGAVHSAALAAWYEVMNGSARRE